MKDIPFVVLATVLLTAIVAAFFRVSTPAAPLDPGDLAVVSLISFLACLGVAKLLRRKKPEERKPE